MKHISQAHVERHAWPATETIQKRLCLQISLCFALLGLVASMLSINCINAFFPRLLPGPLSAPHPWDLTVIVTSDLQAPELVLRDTCHTIVFFSNLVTWHVMGAVLQWYHLAAHCTPMCPKSEQPQCRCSGTEGSRLNSQSVAGSCLLMASTDIIENAKPCTSKCNLTLPTLKPAPLPSFDNCVSGFGVSEK